MTRYVGAGRAFLYCVGLGKGTLYRDEPIVWAGAMLPQVMQLIVRDCAGKGASSPTQQRSVSRTMEKPH